MEVKIKRVDGCVEFFETPQFLVVKPEDMSPVIIRLEVRDNRGKLLLKWKRPNAKEYIKNFKPEPIETIDTEAVREEAAEVPQEAPAPEMPEETKTE